MSGKCYIVGAGEFCGRDLPGQGDYIIAADGGYAQLAARGITPDVVIGDFDSLGGPPKHPNILRSPAEKDDTDMMLAVKEGLARGYETFVIDGGLGGRLDHTLANIQTLVYIANNGARGYLLGRGECVTAVTDGSISFEAGASGLISVFCAGRRAEGVTLTGLKYPLDGAVLTNDCPIGVSNEFTGEAATIEVRKGTVVIITELYWQPPV
ncbi:MAG: thiamine diphosphokinase [Oscillospiraceae bacterium]|jgi:thiamine pyrophosphokinase|nr:thiamine diphosphokinase [Oscillospiraceae bacterium]